MVTMDPWLSAVDAALGRRGRRHTAHIRAQLLAVAGGVRPSCLWDCCAIGPPEAARLLDEHGHVLQAAAQFLRAARADGSLVAARDGLERANSQLVDRWHFTMLNDARRNAAYGRAVRAASRRLAEGELVLDVGAGTGLLSMLAAQAGASPVIACESSEAMCQVAAATLADNALERRVQLVNKWSHELTVGEDLPCRASLLVTETFDAGLLGEHILSTLHHAWRHLLLPPGRGRVLPASATVWAAAVESAEVRSQLSARLPSGGQLRRRLTEPYWSERLDDAPGGYRLLSEPVQVYSVDFNDPDDIERGLSGVEGRHVVQCMADGRLDALVTWFELQLGEGEVLSSAPVAVSSRLLLNMSAVQPGNTEGLDCSAINVFSVRRTGQRSVCVMWRACRGSVVLRCVCIGGISVTSIGCVIGCVAVCPIQRLPTRMSSDFICS
ncbi:Protein arginine N-methyltransferase 9 [Amphibalanus amphitrite]|uniref:Protein arginine N-methyltransferase 9 n=1 Tax=Amphibalanus amphitrite TaxID=1232801 RepID=A0A6A4WGJ9_AMPAM|nr:Protein arginine N-methyltransferase 9 [Amphibalanus amphitrite]